MSFQALLGRSSIIDERQTKNPRELYLVWKRYQFAGGRERARSVAHLYSSHILLDLFTIFMVPDSLCAFTPVLGALWRVALRLMEIILFVHVEDRSA